MNLEKLDRSDCLTKEDIVSLLKLRGDAQDRLFEKAREKRFQTLAHNKVFLRGLIEFSNICSNDCYYCGIRQSNSSVKRYQLSLDDILDCSHQSLSLGMPSIVFQSGERANQGFVEYVSEFLKELTSNHPESRIVLSCGEQTKEVYQKWFDNGAARYLLRLETSSEEHYRMLHPEAMGWQQRNECLRYLREIGYQVGTGVMICSPGQSIEMLADSLLLYKALDVHMIGQGPWMFHPETPFGSQFTEENSPEIFDKEEKLALSLNTIAITRLMMPATNIAAATALEALDVKGRVLGLRAGANVIMPLITPTNVKREYNLYENKTLEQRGFSTSLDRVKEDIQEAGMLPAIGEPGDPAHFLRNSEQIS